jgi:hypothetical protein
MKFAARRGFECASGIRMPKQPTPAQSIIKKAFVGATPSRLWLLLLGIWTCSLAFFLAAAFTVQLHQHALTVGYDAAPSVIAAHEIKTSVETMDADLVNELLYRPEKKAAKAMTDDFERARVQLCKHLVAAARNITFAAEQAPMENVQIALGQYQMRAQVARGVQMQAENRAVQNAYRAAFQTLSQDLLPSADLLDKVNRDVLEDTYVQEKGASAMSRRLVLVLGSLLIALLSYTQIYLSMRFRRRLNLLLLIATACAVLLVSNLNSTLAASSDDLEVAKEDAYDSVVALLDARSNSYDANAAESRWLLDREHASEHERYFRDKIATVARFSDHHNFKETVATVQHQLSSGERINVQGVSGSLADELNNATFKGEGQAALKALQALEVYLDIDKQVRQLENSGDDESAVELALGHAKNSSNYAFNEYDEALGLAIKINKDHMHLAVEDADRRLDGLVLISLITAHAIILLCYGGLRPRMQEYRPTGYFAALHHRKG